MEAPAQDDVNDLYREAQRRADILDEHDLAQNHDLLLVVAQVRRNLQICDPAQIGAYTASLREQLGINHDHIMRTYDKLFAHYKEPDRLPIETFFDFSADEAIRGDMFPGFEHMLRDEFKEFMALGKRYGNWHNRPMGSDSDDQESEEKETETRPGNNSIDSSELSKEIMVFAESVAEFIQNNQDGAPVILREANDVWRVLNHMYFDLTRTYLT